MPMIGTLREQRNGKWCPSHCLSDKRHQPLDDLLRILRGMGYDGARLVRRDGTTERIDFPVTAYAQGKIDDDIAELTAMLDRGTLAGLLENLATVCADKGRAAAGWEERFTSEPWQLIAKAINRAATSALDFGL